MSTETPATIPETEMEERKRELAYQFWEEEGRPEGRAEAHWERACLVLMSLDQDDKAAPDWLQRRSVEATVEVAATAPAQTEEELQDDMAILALRRRIAARGAA